MPPQQLDIIEEIQLREVQAISTRIYSPTNTTSSAAMLLEECKSSKRRSTKWLDDDNNDELMSSSTNTSLAQPTRRITPDNTPSQVLPQHWPISATSSQDIKGHIRPLPFDVFSKKKRKDTTADGNKGDKEREERPVYFYSINTMLHQQDEECWENIISDYDTATEEEDSNEDMMLLGELIHQDTRPAKSCLRNDYSSSSKKSVNFPIEEISSTHSRPRTSTKDIPNLYYTEDEIYTMKCNYRKERKEERKEEKVRAMEEWKKKIQRLYGDGITSYTTEEDDMLVEEACGASSCNLEDDFDAHFCLSWG